MKICVLQPDYSTTDVDYKNYDPKRNLSKLLPDDQVDHVYLNKLTTYRQLRDLGRKGYDVFVNLCEGYPDWEVPSIDVVYAMQSLNLPYTGPDPVLFDPPKPLMKYVAFCAGVNTPASVEIKCMDDISEALKTLRFPMFVKPAHAGDSLGVDDNSYVRTAGQLKTKVASLLASYNEVLVEEYITGREFTVLVAANEDMKGCTSFKPVEYLFPKGRTFKTYALKTSELHPDCNVPCGNARLEKQLRSAGEKIFTAFNGMGYARMDFRLGEDGELYFLEINFTCSVFYEDGYEGSADFVLKFDPIGKSGFLKQIIAEGIARYHARQRKFTLKGSSVSGYGIFASRAIQKGEVVFAGEGLSQRIITKKYVDANWNKRQKQDFRHYAYPVGKDVYVLWDDNPVNWAPQNHSCEPNTQYEGLNVVAIRDIPAGEELTLDYATFLDETTEPFVCQCGSENCREYIVGTRSLGEFSTARPAFAVLKRA
jgi:D-alanine-D-alanine ligase